MQYPLTCVECGAPAKSIYREYSKGRDGRNIKLTRCKECFQLIDKYVEQDGALICLDLTLLRTAAFRHFVFNRVPFAKGITPWFCAMTVLLLFTSVYMKVYTQAVYEFNGGPLPAPALGSIVTSFDGILPSQQHFDESFELLPQELQKPTTMPAGTSLVQLLAQRSQTNATSFEDPRRGDEQLGADRGASSSRDDGSASSTDAPSWISAMSTGIGQFEPVHSWDQPHPADWLWAAAGLGEPTDADDSRRASSPARPWTRVPAFFFAALVENTVFALTCLLAARGLQLSHTAPANTLLVACAGVLPLQGLLLDAPLQPEAALPPQPSHADHRRGRGSSGGPQGLMSVVASRVWAGLQPSAGRGAASRGGGSSEGAPGEPPLPVATTPRVAQTGNQLAGWLLTQWARAQYRAEAVVVRSAGRGDDVVGPAAAQGDARGDSSRQTDPNDEDHEQARSQSTRSAAPADSITLGAYSRYQGLQDEGHVHVGLFGPVLPAVDAALLVGLLTSSTPRLLSLLSVVWAYPAGFFVLVAMLTRAGNMVAVKAVLRCGWDASAVVVAAGISVEIAVRVWLYTAGVVFDVLLV